MFWGTNNAQNGWELKNNATATQIHEIIRPLDQGVKNSFYKAMSQASGSQAKAFSVISVLI